MQVRRTPLRDYLIKGAVTMPDGTQRTMWNDVAVSGPRFQLEFPARLPPRPASYEITMLASKPGTGVSAPAHYTFQCT